MRNIVLVVALAACKSSSDSVVVRVVANTDPTPAGWDAMPYDSVGQICVRNAGKVVFQRPEYTTNAAEPRCYTKGEQAIRVSLALPDAAWDHAGWQRCGPDREREADALCHAPAR